ncbi:MAG: PQQ-binding-like beta-propeller repeat protein [Hyphomonadaceae bacterium]|nr:PQQ-binding-like beta-propeller repeat protein [Hyphomonadaceae bacterium]
MSRLRILASALALSAALLSSCSTASEETTPTAAATPAGPHPGEAVYKQYCASCHDIPEATKSPTRETLARMTSGQIINALITGKMIAQAGPLSSQQVSYVSDYLSDAAAVDDTWLAAMRCPANRRTPKLNAQPTVSTFGFDIRNRRNLSYAQAGLTAADFSNLEVAWVVGFPDAVTMRSQAAVVGNSIFLPVGESKNRVFAFDISDKAKPCIQWVWEGERTIRTSAGYGVRKDGKKVVMVGDMGAYIHMIDATNGKELWASHMGLFPGSISTATPVLVGDKVIAPSSQYEIMMAAQPNYECCKTHGGVVALDAMTGKRVWEGHTMENAKPIRDRGDGKMLWGPAGAPVWNSPSIDLKRNRLYVGTGEANSETAHKNTDALMAFDLADGSIKWAHQATENDVFNVGCGPTGGGLNCSKNTVFRDVDFGASTILATQPNGNEIVVAGQKSGTVWAMNPDTGAVVWKTHIGTGGPNGGIHWGIAVDDTHVYAPISYPGRSIPGQDVDPALKPGLYAVNLADGSIDWKFEVKPDCTDARKKFVPRCNALFGLSGAPTVVGDHIITGGLDGRLYVVERKTGKLVWQYDTAQDYTTVNGVTANGASIDNASIIAVNGLLIMNSGYGLFGQGAGNVMIAFKPKK